MSAASGRGGGRGRSALAIAAGFVTIVVLSLTIDQVIHMLGIYPPWGVPMWETSDNLLALSYRLVIAVFGCWLAARIAPHAPMKHAMVLGWIGLGFGMLGVIGAVAKPLGPMWYPVLLAVTAPLCGWIGGRLYVRGK